MFGSIENYSPQTVSTPPESPEKNLLVKEDKISQNVQRANESAESGDQRQSETPEEREARRQRNREMNLQQQAAAARRKAENIENARRLQEAARARRAANRAKQEAIQASRKSANKKKGKKNAATSPVTIEPPQPVLRRNDETDEEWEIRQQQEAMLYEYHKEKNEETQRLNQLRQLQKESLRMQEAVTNKMDFEQRHRIQLEIARSVSWEQLPDFLVTDPSPAVNERMRNILQGIDFHDLMSRMMREMPKKNFGMYEYPLFRGNVFESLVLEELNGGEPNNAIGYFILDCLKKPAMLGIDKNMLRNPDYLGVTVDQTTGEARITGMYEVKAGDMGDRVNEQLRDFYSNLSEIIERINQQIPLLKKKFKLNIPDTGIVLSSQETIEKMVVIPRPSNDKEVRYAVKKKQFVKQHGWSLASSAFNMDNIDLITIFVREQYRKQMNKKQESPAKTV